MFKLETLAASLMQTVGLIMIQSGLLQDFIRLIRQNIIMSPQFLLKLCILSVKGFSTYINLKS